MDDEDNVAIFSLVLDIANHASPSNDSYKIMYKTIFGNPQLKGYWKVLMEYGLLKYNLSTQTFETTEKGQRFLQAYNRMDPGALTQ